MQIIRMTVIAASIAVLPLAASWAEGSGSDVQPQTQSAAVPGATTSSGSSAGMTTKPTNGTGGGGMSTASGEKAGGMAKQNKVTTGTAQ